MAILTFTGDFIAAQFSIDNNGGGETDFAVGQVPFLATDIVRIEIDDADILPNGEFDPDLVRFLSFSVERGGVEYDFGVNSGSKIKESGGGSNSEQGDSYFMTNDSVSPPASGPFAGLDEQTYLFSSQQSFADGPDDYTLSQTSPDGGGAGNSNFNAQSATICFGKGTHIATINGEVAVENLTIGAMVETVDHGYQPVRFIKRSSYMWSPAPSNGKPVLIPAGALGAGLPFNNLTVSPQHRMLIPGPAATGTALTAAKALCCLPGVRSMNGLRKIDYFHLMFDRHEIIFAEGTPTESFLPGAVALRSLNSADYAIVRGIMQKNTGRAASAECVPARPIARVQATKRQLAGQKYLWTPESLAAATARCQPEFQLREKQYA